MRKVKKDAAIILLFLISIFTINELNAQTDDDEDNYVVCPGWGYKCISITSDSWFGPVTLPVMLKGKDRGAIEFIEKE